MRYPGARTEDWPSVHVGWLASGPNHFEALGLGRLVKGAGHGPNIPTV